MPQKGGRGQKGKKGKGEGKRWEEAGKRGRGRKKGGGEAVKEALITPVRVVTAKNSSISI